MGKLHPLHPLLLPAAIAVCSVALIAGTLFGWPEEDWPGRQICEASVWFWDNQHSFVLAADDRIRAYVAACREIWPKLDEEARKILLGSHATGNLTKALKWNWFWALPIRQPEQCGAFWSPKREEELGEYRKDYLKSGVRPLQERTVLPAQARSAFARGEVARVDGRQLLPERFFNISMADVAVLAPDRGAGTPVYQSRGFEGRESCYAWLKYVTKEGPTWGRWSLRAAVMRVVVVPLVLRVHCTGISQSLQEISEEWWVHSVDTAAWMPFNPLWEHPKESREKAQRLLKERRAVHIGQLNLQRVPQLLAGTDLTSRLGLKDLTELTQSYLWIGNSFGAFHNDPQDNVVVQLAGESEFIVFPPNCSRLVTGQIPFQAGVLQWVRKGMPRGLVQAPFFHIKLRPGQALLLPSMSLHKVVVRDSGRIALNTFFEPRLGHMEWPWAPSNCFRRSQRSQLAMHLVWLRSLRHLWETRGIVVAMHTERMEVL